MPYARLASGGWLARAGRESNPLDSINEFPLSSFPSSQAYPGDRKATLMYFSVPTQRASSLVWRSTNTISAIAAQRECGHDQSRMTMTLRAA